MSDHLTALLDDIEARLAEDKRMGRLHPDVDRVAYEKLVGPADGAWVSQTCGNRRCVRVDHLEARKVRTGAIARGGR